MRGLRSVPRYLSMTYWQKSRLSSGYSRFRPFHQGFEWWHTYWTLVLKHFETISPGGHESHFVIKDHLWPGNLPCDLSLISKDWLMQVAKLPGCCVLPIIAEDGFRFPSPSYYEERVSAQARRSNRKIQEKSRETSWYLWKLMVIYGGLGIPQFRKPQYGLTETFWSILGGSWFRFFAFSSRRSAECPNLRCWICRPLAMEAEWKPLAHGESKAILAGDCFAEKPLEKAWPQSFFGELFWGASKDAS